MAEPAPPSDDGSATVGAARESAGWLYGAPDARGTAEPALTTRIAQAPPQLDVTHGFTPAQGSAAQAIAVSRDPFVRPVLLGLEHSADAVMPAWAHEQALRRLLIPEGDRTAALPALQGWEEAMALGHLRAVLRHAESLDADAFAGVDHWLAALLADAWPRSAPLLDPAAAVFGWAAAGTDEGEGGAGRPAVAFINARLDGMRFVAEGQAPVDGRLRRWWRALRGSFLSQR